MKDIYRHNCQRISAKFYFSLLTIIFWSITLSSFPYQERGLSLHGFLLVFNSVVKHHESVMHGRIGRGIFYKILTMSGASLFCANLIIPGTQEALSSCTERSRHYALYNAVTRVPASICLPNSTLVLSEALPQISHLLLLNDYTKGLQTLESQIFFIHSILLMIF